MLNDNQSTSKATDRYNTILDEELKACNFIKTVLMIMVVFGHATALWSGTWFNQKPVEESLPLQFLSAWVGNFHVPAFTLVSGYIFAYLKYEKEKYNSFFSFVSKKFKRLIIPYIFLCIVWVIPFYCYYFDTNVNEVILKYLLCTSPSQLWFLIMLFNIFVIAFRGSKIAIKKPILSVVVALLVYCIFRFLEKYVDNYFQIINVFKYYFFFLIGIIFRVYGLIFLKKIPSVVYVILYTLLSVINSSLVIFFDSNGTFFLKAASVGSDLLTKTFGAIAAFVVLQRIAGGVSPENRLYSLLEEHGFTIYLFHQQIIYILITAFNGVIPPVLLAITNFVVSLCVSLIISVILDKWKFTRFLVGKK